jgi:hypothetical protein
MPRRACHIVDDFLPAELAQSLRAGVEAHFLHPGQHRPETHQVWNYWFVPGAYAYFRSNPEKVFGHEPAERFMAALTGWSAARLGLRHVTWPYLSLYLPGCRQGLHNESANGRFAFVYSLTRDARRTEGGDTLIYRDENPFRAHLTQPAAGHGFYEQVAPRFNRLVAFDDRLPHAVTQLEGVMDPLEGRFVLHGHLSEAGPLLEGAVPPTALPVLEAAVAAWRQHPALAPFHGLLCLRLAVAESGVVGEVSVLVDRVMHPAAEGDEGWPPLRQALVVALLGCRLPEGGGAVTLPLALGAVPPG